MGTIIDMLSVVLVFWGICLFIWGLEKAIDKLNWSGVVIVSILVLAGWVIILRPIAGMVGVYNLLLYCVVGVFGFIVTSSLFTGIFHVLSFLALFPQKHYFSVLERNLFYIVCFLVFCIVDILFLMLHDSLSLPLFGLLMSSTALLGFWDICKILYKKIRK